MPLNKARKKHKFLKRLTSSLILWMPLVILTFITLYNLENTIQIFESSATAKFENRFPLADLKSSTEQFSDQVDTLFLEPDVPKHRSDIKKVRDSINNQIQKLVSSENLGPEGSGLLSGIQASVDETYLQTQNISATDSRSLSSIQTRKEHEKIHVNINNMQDAIDQILLLEDHIQASENLKVARKIKQRFRSQVLFLFIATSVLWIVTRAISF